MMINRIPIRRAHVLVILDEDKCLEGYRDGMAHEPCGDNRSFSHWHGWRNGMVDGGHAEKDDAQAELAHSYTQWQKTGVQ